MIKEKFANLNFKNIFAITKTNKTQEKASVSTLTASFSPLFFDGLDSFGNANDKALLNTYQTSIYVYRAVKLISETASSYPLQVLRISNIRGDTEEVLNSPALDILSTDPHTKNVSSLLQAIYTHRLLTGKAYLLRTDEGLKIIPPNNVEENINRRDNTIRSYKIEDGASRMTVEPDRVIAFRELNPADFNNASSATQAARFRVLLEQKIVAYQNSLMDNGAVPGKIISPKEVKGTVSKDKSDEAQRGFDRIFKGVENQGKTLISPTPLEVHQLSSSMKDLELQKQLDFTAKEIEIAFGLPHGILQSETVNVADGNNSKNTLIENTIRPLVNDVVSTLNNELVEQFGNRIFYKAEVPVMENEKTQADVLTAYVEKGIMTQDEARLKLGLTAKGGDADELIRNRQSGDSSRQEAMAMISKRKKLFIELEVQQKEFEKLAKNKSVL